MDLNKSDSGVSKAGLISTGISGLDEILFGGLPPQSVVLIQGEAGAGKTTAGLQFLLEGVARGERCLIVSVSQNRHELERVADSHGMDLSGITTRSVGVREGSQPRQFSLDSSEAELEELLREIYDAIEESVPDRLVFDSLLELRLLSPDDAFYRSEILKLKRYLVSRSISAYILDHLDLGALDRKIEGIAHGVISLEMHTPRIGRTLRQIQVRKFRGHPFVEGHHDFKIREGGVEVFPRVIPRDLPPCELGPSLAMESEALTRMLGGGLEYASTTLVAGQSGTGKSTLSTVFATAAAEAGVNAGLFLFEERPEVYRTRSEGVGLPVTKYEDQGRLFFHHFDPAEISAGEFSQTVLARVEKDDLGLVVIDSLSGYLNALPDDENLITQIYSLLQYLSRRGTIAIVTMAQHGLMGEEPRSDIDVSFIADSVILLRHFAAAGEIRRTIAVLKKRHSPHERRIKNFVIAPGQVEVADFDDGERASIDAAAGTAGTA